ncbi:hypothetical protein VTN96DRAFT_5716 [Rasamsonia emersonii]
MSATGSESLQPPARAKRPVTHGMSYPRKRAVSACQLCRRRKTKCDNVRPTCGFCASIGATCVYQASHTDYSSFDPASLVLLERINHVVALLESGRAARPEPATLPDQHTTADILPDALEIPARCNLSCRVLKWPILQDCGFDPDALDSLFALEPETAPPGLERSQGVVEEDIPAHVRRFLTNVHTKNPVVDHRQLTRDARHIAEHGLSWNAPTCIVLLACALGILSQPFRRTTVSQPREPTADRALADAYYAAARKRIGLLDPSSLSYLQARFLSGVYEMYTLRPLDAWHSFHSACSAMQLYLQKRAPGNDEIRDLEQRVYWSCLKSECELRTEINLASSRIAELRFTEEFPTPPVESVETPEEFPLEESWYYYLTEISQRHILDRIMNAFYAEEDDRRWLDASPEAMVRMASELERQHVLALANLPSWLRYDEGQPEDCELPFFLHCRIFYVQECLFRPFLFRVIHSPVPQPPAIQDFAQRCVEASYNNARCVTLQHRHHGSWFMGRAAFRCGLSLLAAAHSGKVEMPPDWRQCVETALVTTEFWGEEAVDLRKLGRIFRTIYERLSKNVD